MKGMATKEWQDECKKEAKTLSQLLLVIQLLSHSVTQLISLYIFVLAWLTYLLFNFIFIKGTLDLITPLKSPQAPFLYLSLLAWYISNCFKNLSSFFMSYYQFLRAPRRSHASIVAHARPLSILHTVNVLRVSMVTAVNTVSSFKMAKTNRLSCNETVISFKCAIQLSNSETTLPWNKLANIWLSLIISRLQLAYI